MTNPRYYRWYDFTSEQWKEEEWKEYEVTMRQEDADLIEDYEEWPPRTSLKWALLNIRLQLFSRTPEITRWSRRERLTAAFWWLMLGLRLRRHTTGYIHEGRWFWDRRTL